MGCCTCCEPTAEGRIFKPARERWCTDILCLLMFIAAWAAGITLAVVSINKDTTLLTVCLPIPTQPQPDASTLAHPYQTAPSNLSENPSSFMHSKLP